MQKVIASPKIVEPVSNLREIGASAFTFEMHASAFDGILGRLEPAYRYICPDSGANQE